jgi:DNA invertase Pin-like site-specific DNA recombinase
MATDANARTVFLKTLEELLAVTTANVERSNLIRERIARLKAQVAEGVPLVESLAKEESPLVVELITENIFALQEVGARLRWSEAVLLNADGMTVADIARLFGVSRQRVSALINTPPAAVDG